MDYQMDGKICIKVEPRGEANSDDKPWDDGLVGRIKQILVWYDEDFLSGFQTIYECMGKSLISKRHGGSHGNFEMINPKKPLTWLSGYYGTFRVDPELFQTDEETEPWNFYKCISSLKFGNEEETYGPFGCVKGTPFSFCGNTEIVGFHGCSNDGSYGNISAMGVYFKTEAVGVIGQPANPEESVEMIEEKKPKFKSGVLSPQLKSGVLSPKLKSGVLSPQLKSGVLSPQLKSAVLSPKLKSGVLSPKLKSGVLSPSLSIRKV